MEIQDEIHALRNAWRLLGPDWNRRIQAANRLAETGSVEAVPDLFSVTIENKNLELVKAAIRALSQIHAEAAVTALGQALNNISDENQASQCLDGLLAALKNGSPAASQALTSLSDRFFPVLLNRANLGEPQARQAILQMGKPGIDKLYEALRIPGTWDIANSLLKEFGETGIKPLSNI